MAGEKTLRRYVATMLKAHGQVTQLESGATAAGVPDTLFFDSTEERDVWIELKHGSPKKKWELRKTQIAWMRARLRNGGHTFILLKYEGGKPLYALIKVDTEEKLRRLNGSKNVLTWAMCADAEWDGNVPAHELIEELRK